MKVLKTAAATFAVAAWAVVLLFGGLMAAEQMEARKGDRINAASLATARKRLDAIHHSHELVASRMEVAERRVWIARGLEAEYIRRIKEAEAAAADATAAAAADKAVAEAERARLQQTLEAVKAAIAADVLTSR